MGSFNVLFCKIVLFRRRIIIIDQFIKKNIGSYKNSKRNIESEILRIINENFFLQYILSNCDEEILWTSLNIVKPKKTIGSLAVLDDFEGYEYQNFIRLSHIEEESAFGMEPFPEELMSSCHETNLPADILDLLVNIIIIRTMIISYLYHPS